MAASWTLVLVAVVSFLVIGHIETTVAKDLPATAVEGPTTANSSTTPTNGNDVTVDQLLGKWYIVRMIFPFGDTSSRHLQCIETNILRGDDGDKSFKAYNYKVVKNREKFTFMKGRVDNNTMEMTVQSSYITSTRVYETYVYNVTFYNHGHEFIAYEKNLKRYELYSHSAHPVWETVKIFESLVKPDMSLVYVFYNNCP